MKIKTKKTMTLCELIKWAWENPELTNDKKFFSRNSCYSGSVEFCSGINRTIVINHIMFDDEFEVEVEEEITEETKFDKLVEMERDGDLTIWENRSIKSLVTDFSKAFYILNDNLTMTLIWKDGELAE
ncbi:TPA: hypothetical protein ACN4YA_000169 [Staphylococcus aureus]|uniref:hypothetical protein n=1 Tax=Staphylococcus aureus TaxID=1280 RepID=UPI0024171127|nr:hypothetical protein [Staphylococcus aureus]